MYFLWNDDTVRWFFAASEQTGFHRELAGWLRPRLTCGATVADFGCGLGLIDLELADYAGHITCIDRAQEPLNALQAEAARRGIQNVETLCADSGELTGEWDEVIMTFHGAGAALLDCFLPHCRKSLVAVIRSGAESAFSPLGWHKAHKNLLERTTQALDRRGVQYTLEVGALEYGQPLQDRADAVKFVRARCQDSVPDDAVRRYLDETLEQRDDPEWPLYLPNHKWLGMVVIPRKENEHLISLREEMAR